MSKHNQFVNDQSSSYQPHDLQFGFSFLDPSTPPPPPPKPLNHEISGGDTTQSGQSLPRPLPPESSPYLPRQQENYTPFPISIPLSQSQPPIPEDGWLPDLLRGKSKTDLSQVLSSPTLLSALVNSRTNTHPSISTSLQPIQAALQANIKLAQQVVLLSGQLNHLRSKTESQLLHLHALERQWRQKQSELDVALEPFSPKALYQWLAISIGEQEQVCQALEESFLEGDGKAGDRDVSEFLKRYREGRKLVWVRKERKERWDEGRVGGWR